MCIRDSYFIIVDGANARESSNFELSISCTSTTPIQTSVLSLNSASILTATPNPANSQILINFKSFQNTSGTLFFMNSLGQILQSIPIKNTNIIQSYMDVSNYPEGTYFVVLKTNEMVKVQAVLIAR